MNYSNNSDNMVDEEINSSDSFSECINGSQEIVLINKKSYVKSIRLTLFMSLIQGFNERLFYSMLLFGYFTKSQMESLNSEWLLFSQHFLGCMGFLLWSIICNYFKPLFVLSISFFLWGSVSIIQPFMNSFASLLLCRYILSVSYSALQPSIQVIAEEYILKKKDLAKFFGAVSCYRHFGAFLATSYVTMMHMYRSEKSFKVYSRNIWIISGLISISMSIVIIRFLLNNYKKMCENYDCKLTFRESWKRVFSKDCILNQKNSKKDIFILRSIFITLLIIGIFSSIIWEIYNSFQFTSSFYFKRYVTSTNINQNMEAYLITLNLTYYTLKNVIFLSGSAIGSLIFGILYHKIYFYLKRLQEKYKINSIDSIGKGNFRNLYCLSAILLLILFIMNILTFQFLLEIPNIVKFTVIEITDNSISVGWIALHLIGIFIMGFLLTIIIDVILRFEIIIINKNRSSVIFYGSYLMFIGVLSNSSLYKYLNIFRADKNYIVDVSDVSKVNILPTIFNYPIKMFFPIHLIQKITDKKLDNYIHIQEIQMNASIFSILFYIFISFISVSLLIFMLTKHKINKNNEEE